MPFLWNIERLDYFGSFSDNVWLLLLGFIATCCIYESCSLYFLAGVRCGRWWVGPWVSQVSCWEAVHSAHMLRHHNPPQPETKSATTPLIASYFPPRTTTPHWSNKMRRCSLVFQLNSRAGGFGVIGGVAIWWLSPSSVRTGSCYTSTVTLGWITWWGRSTPSTDKTSMSG